MADHAENSGQICAADRVKRALPSRTRAGEQRAKDEAAQVDSRNALAHVTEGREHSGQLAVGAQHIRHARVAAAMVAHIIVVHDFRNQHAEQDAAQQVTACCGQHAGQKDIFHHGLHLSCLDRAVAVLAGNHLDGGAGQAERLTNLVFQVALVREMEQCFLVDEADERRRAG